MKIEIQLKVDTEQFGLVYDDERFGHRGINNTKEFRKVWDELGYSLERKLLEEKYVEEETE